MPTRKENERRLIHVVFARVDGLIWSAKSAGF